MTLDEYFYNLPSSKAQAEAGGVFPFSNGTEFMAWQGRNCDRCAKYSPDVPPHESQCDLEVNIGYAVCNYGAITRAVADRLGYVEDGYIADDCPEILYGEYDPPAPPPPPTDPNQTSLFTQ